MPKSEQITHALKANRPNLSQSSLRTYSSILSNLFKKVFPDSELDLAKFENEKKFLNFMKNMDSSKRKTYLSALIVLCPDCKEYSEQMNRDGQAFKAKQKLQVKTEKQKANWVDQHELHEVIDNLEKQAALIFKLKNPIMSQLQVCQNYIILCLMSGKYIPIRRSLDWTEMKIKNYDLEKDNALQPGSNKQWKFIFNIYKTQRFHDEQYIIIPKGLKTILKKWLSLLNKVCSESEYLFIDNKCNKLTPTKVTQRLNAIFGKKASINILRHSFLSEKYKNMPSLNELETEANAMGHSLQEHIQYVLKDEDH